MSKIGGDVKFNFSLSEKDRQDFERKLYELMNEYEIYKVDVSINPYSQKEDQG